MKAIMHEAVSGLRVNFLKSELISIGVDKEKMSTLADIMGCKVGDLGFLFGFALVCRGVHGLGRAEAYQGLAQL